MRSDPGIPARIDPAAVYGLGFMRGSRLRFLLSLLGFLYGTIPEPEAVVSGFQDVAVVSEAIQESGRHLGVTEDGGPFAKAEIGGDDDAGALVELAEKMEQQSAA